MAAPETACGDADSDSHVQEPAEIALEQFRAIDGAPGVQFISLQKEVRERDRAALEAWSGLQHLGDALRSFADTATVADLLDVVVSVDTSLARSRSA